MTPPRSLLALCCLLGTAFSPAHAAERLVWFGSYTGASTQSEGIYVSRFDDATGKLSPAQLAGKAVNPSFLAIHPRLPMLYAVSEVLKYEGKSSGAVAAFAFDLNTGILTPKGVQPSGGAAPCHLTVDPSGRTVLAANYLGGSTICLGIDADGILQPVANDAAPQAAGLQQHGYARAGEFGVRASRQSEPHAHSVEVTPNGRFALVCDLGLDQVIAYRLEAEKATLAPHGFARVKSGAGARRSAFHPNGRLAYVVNELDLTVTVFELEAEAGSLREVQTLSTLPAEVTDRKGFSCAEIAVHPSGKFLYASNRGHDSIAMYAVEEATGRLSFLGVQAIEGAMPRHFAVDPSGKFLLVGGQNSNTVAVFAIDAVSGKLKFTGSKIDVPSPVTIVFGRL